MYPRLSVWEFFDRKRSTSTLCHDIRLDLYRLRLPFEAGGSFLFLHRFHRNHHIMLTLLILWRINHSQLVLDSSNLIMFI